MGSSSRQNEDAPRGEHARAYEEQLDVAVEAAREAADLIRSHAGHLRSESVREKAPNELVTRVDEESQRLITEHVRRRFPAYDVLAEEGADLEHRNAQIEGFRWIIDPIDGTTNFTRGVPPYAVSIALQHDDDVVVGVVLEVSRGELFTAVRGGGAYLNDEHLHVSRTETLEDSLLTTGFPYRAFDHADLYLSVLKQFMQTTRGVRRPGAASVDLAWVAAGRFDGFFESGLSPWDVAAGMLLVEEAGGTVTGFRDQPRPLFDQQIVASNARLHAALLDVLRPLRDVRA